MRREGKEEEKEEEQRKKKGEEKEEGKSRECVSRDLSHHDTNSSFSNLPLLRYSLIS